MNLPEITFPTTKGSFYYSSFVSTVDGKVMVKKDGYWPLGSEHDLNYFTYLRSFSDVIIDGKKTAVQFGDRTIKRIHDEEFNRLRIRAGKNKQADYMVITSNPDSSLIYALKNSYGYKPYILTTQNAEVNPELDSLTNVIRLKSNSNGLVDLSAVHNYLQNAQYRTIFIDGGSRLIASYFQQNLIDELFITIAPKIVGSEDDTTISLVEGILFPPEHIKNLQLLSVDSVENEVYLRYKVK